MGQLISSTVTFIIYCLAFSLTFLTGIVSLVGMCIEYLVIGGAYAAGFAWGHLYSGFCGGFHHAITIIQERMKDAKDGSDIQD